MMLARGKTCAWSPVARLVKGYLYYLKVKVKDSGAREAVEFAVWGDWVQW